MAYFCVRVSVLDRGGGVTGWAYFCVCINVRKTKVMIFSRVPKLMSKPVDVVWDCKYLGVKFNYNNKFKKAQQFTVFTCKQGYVFIVKKMSAA